MTEIYNNLQPPDILGNLQRGIGTANALSGMRDRSDERKRQAGVRNVLTEEGLGSPDALQHIAEIDPQAAVSMAPIIQSAQQNAVSTEVRKHDLYQQSLTNIKGQLQDALKTNPDMTPADQDKLVNDLWQPQRYQLEKAIPSTPRSQLTKPASPIFMGGRGLYKEDIPQVLSTQELLNSHEFQDRILSQYGQLMNVTDASGNTKTIMGTPTQALAAAGENGQASPVAVGQKPFGTMDKKEKADLVKEYGSKYEDSQPAKTYGVIRDAYQRAMKAMPTSVGGTAEKASPGADMTLIYSVMKAQDPNSTVMQGEYATAANSGSVSQQVVGLYNSLVKGSGKLDDKQRADFLGQIHDFHENAHGNLQALKEGYRAIGGHIGFDPESTIFPRVPEVKPGQRPAVSKETEGGNAGNAPETPKRRASDGGGNIQTVTTQAAYDALPKGAKYRDSAGNIATKR